MNVDALSVGRLSDHRGARLTSVTGDRAVTRCSGKRWS